MGVIPVQGVDIEHVRCELAGMVAQLRQDQRLLDNCVLLEPPLVADIAHLLQELSLRVASCLHDLQATRRELTQLRNICNGHLAADDSDESDQDDEEGDLLDS